jgi:hypothetical protein
MFNTTKQPVHEGPPAPPGTRCFCRQPALFKCDGCGDTFCRFHWYRHSHTSKAFMEQEANARRQMRR